MELITYDEDADDLPQQRWLIFLVGPQAIVLRTNDLGRPRVAARVGVGVAALPDFMGEKDPLLRKVPFQGSPVTREIRRIIHDDLRSSPPVRTALENAWASSTDRDVGLS